MFIIECFPFSKGLNKESLSYFSPKFIEPGSLIKINLRGKNIYALVFKSRDATEIKSEIKNADFQLKKIISLSAKPFLQKEFLEAAEKTGAYFAGTTGAVLGQLIPVFVLDNLDILSKDISWDQDSKIISDQNNTRSEVAILQSEDEERFIHYRSLIREEFAKNQSIFLCLPQNEDVRQAREKLERGIESFVCTFHNEMGKKDLKEELKKIKKTKHPILIIGTAKWLFLLRKDFNTIIIDKENESGWKTLSRPFIDLRFFAEALARQKNIRLIIGDTFLKTETLYRYKQNEVGEFENIKWRLTGNTQTQLIDLKKTVKKDKEFKTLSPELGDLMVETIEKGSHIFIFAVRKGLSAVTVCRDCGEQVKCNNCSSPMILYGTKAGNAFKCHQCGEMRDAAEVCQKCNSWKLATFGAGIDRVAEEIKKDFPQIKLFELNKEATETNIKINETIKNFYETRGSVLLGTEMAFSYLYKKVSFSAISSFDSLFSIPDFRIREKIFRLILKTKDIAKEKFLIQTRNPEDKTIEFALAGNLVEFYRNEIEDRRVLEYPPFSVFIKITVRGTKNFANREMENLAKILTDFNPVIFPSTHEKRGEPVALNAVIKIAREKWPARNALASEAGGPALSLLTLLKSLPPHFEIKVNPDNLL